MTLTLTGVYLIYSLCMNQALSSIKEAKTRLLLTQIDRIGQAYFQDSVERDSFYSLVCLESSFNSKIVSPAGAVGLTQIMPEFAQSFADECALGSVHKEDLYIPEVNLNLGACQYRHLLDTFDGRIPLALAAYNSGKFSKSVKALKEGRKQAMHPETRKYIEKYNKLANIIVPTN